MSPGKTGDVLIESDKQWSLRPRQWRWQWKEVVAANQLPVALASREEGEEELAIADEEGGEQQVVLGRREEQQRPPGLSRGAEWVRERGPGEWVGEHGGEEERWLLTSAFYIAFYRFYNYNDE